MFNMCMLKQTSFLKYLETQDFYFFFLDLSFFFLLKILTESGIASWILWAS